MVRFLKKPTRITGIKVAPKLEISILFNPAFLFHLNDKKKKRKTFFLIKNVHFFNNFEKKS